MSDLPGTARRLVAPALAGLALSLIWIPVAAPWRVLAARDVLQFFLPLRVSLVRLAAFGLPEWNPWIQGGQPLLSDPSYAAWYPPTWLAFLVGATRSIGLGALLHAAWAAAGAYLLARRLGARREAASLAALAFPAGGAFVSLVHASGHLSGAAWLPWALLAAEGVARAAPGPESRAAALRLALVGGALLLNGEPVTLLAESLAAVVWIVAAAPRKLRALGYALLAGLVAAGLAAVQLLPALVRLAESARGSGLAASEALDWSLPPLRIGELLIPHLLGDPARVGEQLWFGWGLVDRNFPFVLTLAPGTAVLALAGFGWMTRGTPRRILLGLLAILGLALALGRHLPFLPALHAVGFPFSTVRFPEKFVFPTGAAIAFAAAFGLDRLLDACGRREHSALRRFERLAVGMLGVYLALGALVLVAPPALARWLAAHSAAGTRADAAAPAIAYHRRELARLIVAAALVAVVAALARRGRLAGAGVAASLILITGAELLLLDVPLLPKLPASTLHQPPGLARQALETPGRLWSGPDAAGLPAIGPAGGLEAHARAVAARLDPASGVLWGMSYALSGDYARTLTAPARRALEVSKRLKQAGPEAFDRWAGAWSVRWKIEPLPPAAWLAERSAGSEVPPARLEALRSTLPTIRWAAAASSLSDPHEAVRAALAAGLPLASREYLVAAPGLYPERYDATRSLRILSDGGARLELEVGPGDEGLLVVARTWDPGWTSSWRGGELPVLETAAGYLAVPVPAEARRLTLVYRDSWVRVGGGVTVATLALLFLATLRGRRAHA